MESRLVELHQQGAAKRLDPDEKTVEAMTGGEGDLLCQMVDLAAVLQECDEVDQLVLRNTGMTDTLLQYLVPAIIKSKSQVENINLNLNEISPDGAETLVHLVREKPSIKSLLLFGNQLGDEGITRLMTGLSQLCHMDVYTLSELDLGENQIASTGLKSVAAFLRLNPPLKHLGLAHSTTKSWAAWEELFDAITMNTNLAHLLLDDNHLGDEGARLICGIIRQNRTLLSIDLDSNDIGEEGALAIIESLESKADCALTAISLDNNYISTETRETIENILRNNTD